MNNENRIVISPSIGTYLVPSAFFFPLVLLSASFLPDLRPIIILALVYLCIIVVILRQRIVISSDKVCVRTLLKSTCIDNETITSVKQVHLLTTRITATRLRIIYTEKLSRESRQIDINLKIFSRKDNKLLLNRLDDAVRST